MLSPIIISSTDGQGPAQLVKIWIILRGQHKTDFNLAERQRRNAK